MSPYSFYLIVINGDTPHPYRFVYFWDMNETDSLELLARTDYALMMEENKKMGLKPNDDLKLKAEKIQVAELIGPQPFLYDSALAGISNLNPPTYEQLEDQQKQNKANAEVLPEPPGTVPLDPPETVVGV